MRHPTMRHLTLGSAALAVALLGGAFPAAAQQPADWTRSGQATANDKYSTTPSQQHDMMQALHHEQTQNAPSGFDGRVGSKVPDSMQTRRLPDQASDQAPQTKGLLFVRLPDRVLLIDPDDKQIVEIVADEGTTGSGPGSNSSGTDANRGNDNK